MVSRAMTNRTIETGRLIATTRETNQQLKQQIIELRRITRIMCYLMLLTLLLSCIIVVARRYAFCSYIFSSLHRLEILLRRALNSSIDSHFLFPTNNKKGTIRLQSGDLTRNFYRIVV